MKLALIQQHCTRDKQENVARGVSAVREAASNGAKVVAFAELAFEWFYPQVPAEGDVSHLAEPVPGPTTEVFCELARSLGIVILINLYERDGERLYDCSPVIDSDGTILGATRMIHITDFPCFHERGYYHPGDRGAPVYETAMGRIGIAICYDRHFPEYMRALALAGAELVVVPQAGAVGEWPDGLYEAELQVAAFQNGYFAALCNRVGKEDCVDFAGESYVASPSGVVIGRAPAEQDAILYADIDLSEVPASHARRLFMPDRRPSLYPDWLETHASDPS